MTGAGFGANASGGVAECRHDAVANVDRCEQAPTPFTANSTGHFSMTKVSLFNQAGSAHVVFDVAGWFS